MGPRLDDLGLERTANTVIAPEHNPVSPDLRVREAAYWHMQAVVDCCAAVGSSLLCGPHQVALGVFTGAGPTSEEWERSVDHLRRVAEYAEQAGVMLAEEVVNRFELYHLNTLDQAISFVDEVGHSSCRIHLDTFHAHIEEKHPADAIRRAGDRIAHVHISKTIAECLERECRLGRDVRGAPGDSLRRVANRRGIWEPSPQSCRRHPDLAAAVRRRRPAGPGGPFLPPEPSARVTTCRGPQRVTMLMYVQAVISVPRLPGNAGKGEALLSGQRYVRMRARPLSVAYPRRPPPHVREPHR